MPRPLSELNSLSSGCQRLDDRDALTCEYFAAHPDVVALDLIGRTLRVRGSESACSAVIVETEAYGGVDDLASHAAFRPGGRAAIMWEAPGFIYVYAAYGMYPCLNIVTRPEGEPSAVLIRGILPLGATKPVSGPGRSARLLGVTLDDQGETVGGARFSISTSKEPLEVERTQRIGITRGVETEWRYVARFE